MLNCIIIEDQPLAQRMLKRYVDTIAILNLKKVFKDVVKAREYMTKHKIDLIFLDIHLPKMSGMDFLSITPDHPRVILTTAFSEYALESYNYNVVDYLLKPFSYERFNQAILKLRMSLNRENDTHLSDVIIIKSGHEIIQIPASEIISISADSDYTEVRTNDKVYLSSLTLKEWLRKLGADYFCQIHRSSIINVRHFKKLSGNKVTLTYGELSVGRVYKKDFVSCLCNQGGIS
jgi:DNA-binding LytR/AlgR family response regulator